jgi:hypothetical protein
VDSLKPITVFIALWAIKRIIQLRFFPYGATAKPANSVCFHTSSNLSSSHSMITTSASWVYSPFSLAWSIAPASMLNTPQNTRLPLFSFHSEEVMRADGNVKMYQVKDDPKERATIVGFEKRFIAVPIRNKGLGAIVSALANID